MLTQSAIPALHPTLPFPTPLGMPADEGDGEVILPSPDELAANWAAGLGAHDGNSSTPSGWWGGIVAPNALYDGVQVAVYDGVESAEECCRVTQEWRADNRTGHPNLFNWCPLNRTEDCRCRGRECRLAAGGTQEVAARCSISASSYWKPRAFVRVLRLLAQQTCPAEIGNPTPYPHFHPAATSRRTN